MTYSKRQSTKGFNVQQRVCEAPDCTESGDYKAPKSSYNLHEYQYFCLAHVQEFNKKWNFFGDMPSEDIEEFMHDAVTGHRPTWKREDILSGGKWVGNEKLEAELERFLRGAFQKPKPKILSTSQKEREALALLSLDNAVNLLQLKEAYRALVKRFHPDLHQGSKDYEEKFKQITEAYYYLKDLYKSE